jgi:hypothetical protein
MPTSQHTPATTMHEHRRQARPADASHPPPTLGTTTQLQALAHATHHVAAAHCMQQSTPWENHRRIVQPVGYWLAAAALQRCCLTCLRGAQLKRHTHTPCCVHAVAGSSKEAPPRSQHCQIHMGAAEGHAGSRRDGQAASPGAPRLETCSAKDQTSNLEPNPVPARPGPCSQPEAGLWAYAKVFHNHTCPQQQDHGSQDGAVTRPPRLPPPLPNNVSPSCPPVTDTGSQQTVTPGTAAGLGCGMSNPLAAGIYSCHRPAHDVPQPAATNTAGACASIVAAPAITERHPATVKHQMWGLCFADCDKLTRTRLEQVALETGT